MNPLPAHTKNSAYSNVPISSSSAQNLMAPTGQQQQNQQSISAFVGTAATSTVSSFTPLANVDTTSIGMRGSVPDYGGYYGHFPPNPHTSANPLPSAPSFASSLLFDTDAYNGPSTLSMRSGLSLVTPGNPHIPSTYVGSSNFPSHGLTSRLPDLHFQPTTTSGIVPQYPVIPHDAMDASYSAAHMMNVMSTSPHHQLLSPVYSSCSATTHGSGGGTGGGRGGGRGRKSHAATAASASASYEVESGSNSMRALSKKESHNRIERKRRDYINTQISTLSSLLPDEKYRDVEGRRNKGTVLRLAVLYIVELRREVQLGQAFQEEANLARSLIPHLDSYIQALENALRDAEVSTGRPIGSLTAGVDDSLPNYRTMLQNWQSSVHANNLRVIEYQNQPPPELAELENIQTTFSPGRPSTSTAHSMTPSTSFSSYHPNAAFVGGPSTSGPVLKKEESDDLSYGSNPIPDNTTDALYDSANNTQLSGSTTASGSSFLQQLTPSSQMDRSQHDSSMQVECQDH